MGMPMAQNLMDAGYSVIGYRRGDASAFAARNGIVAESPRQVVEEADAVLCCIPNDEALEDVVSGPSGLTSGDCTGKVLVELSTLSAAVKESQKTALAARGGAMLDGAISGLPPMVANKSALFFLSGDAEIYDQVHPALQVLTEKLHFMGAFGSATKTKLCANMLVAINIASIAEMLAFGGKLGLQTEALVGALRESAGSSLQFNARAGRMVSGDWDKVLGATAMLAKDVHLISNAAANANCPTPILDVTATLYDAAMIDGQGQKDVAAIYATIAKAAGLPAPGGS